MKVSLSKCKKLRQRNRQVSPPIGLMQNLLREKQHMLMPLHRRKSDAQQTMQEPERLKVSSLQAMLESIRRIR